MRIGLGRESQAGRRSEDPELGRATFAGRCSWAWQDAFCQVSGVISVTLGHIGGYADEPACVQVSAGNAGREQALQILFDLRRVSYAHLLSLFFRIIDFAQLGRHQVNTGAVAFVLCHDERQQDKAQLMLAEWSILQRSGSVLIEPAGGFCPRGD